MTIPLPIETERLLIRPFEASDVDSMADNYGDPAVMQHVCLGIHPPTGEPELGCTLATQRLGMRPVETISVDGRLHVLLALERS